MGWVSILNPAEVKDCLEVPESIELVAYLCLGYVAAFLIDRCWKKSAGKRNYPSKFLSFGIIGAKKRNSQNICSNRIDGFFHFKFVANEMALT